MSMWICENDRMNDRGLSVGIRVGRARIRLVACVSALLHRDEEFQFKGALQTARVARSIQGTAFVDCGKGCVRRGVHESFDSFT